MEKLQIIYEDEAVVVCHKLPGIPVQTPKAGQQDMVSLLRNYYTRKKENNQVFIVHRLDQPVEGVMVFARTKDAAAKLSRQVQERQMDKQYLAVVQGIWEEKSGVLENYLLRDGRTNTSKVVLKGTTGAKKARLSYEVEAVSNEASSDEEKGRKKECSLVRIWLETGRHHQIRVQMAHAGHPLVGDKKYNPGCAAGYQPIGLCSVKLSFMHPVTGKSMEFTVEPQGSVFQPQAESEV